MATLRQQISLRLGDNHEKLIQAKLIELRAKSQYPEEVKKADAIRALIEEAGNKEVAHVEQ